MEHSKEINFWQLEDIQNSCLKLMDATIWLGEKESELAEDIRKSLRKIILAHHFSDRQIICVSGLQGVGKTTLMKNFYGLPEDFFKICVGRGEKIPLLITEKENCQQPQMNVMQLSQSDDDHHKLRLISVESREEFINAATGSSSDIMYLELFVPCQHTYNDKISFMLLPGYEARGPEDYWENLIDFSVKCSDSAVFLLNGSKLADAENHEKLQRSRKQFGDNLIYVLTGSDLDSTHNLENKETLRNLLSIDESHIICAGSYEKGTKDDTAWIEAFKAAIDRFYNNPAQSRAQCSRYIYREIADNIRPLIWELRAKLSESAGDDVLAQVKTSDILKKFDTATASFKRKYMTALEGNLQQAREDSLSYVRQEFEKNDTFLKGIKRFFVGKTVRDTNNARRLVKDAVMQGNGPHTQMKAAGQCLEALNSLASAVSSENKTHEWMLEEANGSSALANPFEEVSSPMDASLFVVPVLQNVMTLLAPHPDSTQELKSVGVRKNLDPINTTITAIAELGTCYYCSSATTRIPDAEVGPLADNKATISSIMEGAKSTKNFGLGMLGIVGLDVAKDGEFNLIEKVAEAFSITTPHAMIGVAAAAAIGAGMTMAKDLTRMARDDMATCESAVNAVYDKMQYECLENYSQYMDRIRERLEKNLCEVYRVGREETQKYNSYVALNRIEDSLKEFLRVVEGNAYGTESNFVGIQ